MVVSREGEIHDLVRRLGSRTPAVVDAARARLSIIGPRAVEHLIEALDDDDNRIRARVMPLLALIKDPRGRAPLTAMLLDRSSRLRELAAQSLGRFPHRESVAALKKLLERERNHRARSAAVHALVEQYASGQEEAIGIVLERLTDVAERSTVRTAALSVLRHLKAPQRRSIATRFRNDPDLALRARAEQALLSRENEPAAASITSMIADLGADDYALWNRAVGRLATYGAPAIESLLAAMRDRASDPEFCTRAGMALKAMGPRRGRLLADALDTLKEPLPLQVLIEAIGAIGDKASIYRLKDLIERLRDPQPNGTDNGVDPVQRVRAKAHLELARVGSRVAIQDLRELLSSPARRVELEMLGALELVGNREEIAALLGAHAREEEFMRQRIAGVVRAIMTRERIRRNNKMFQTLGTTQRQALDEIFPPGPTSAGRERPRSRPLPADPSAGPG